MKRRNAPRPCSLSAAFSRPSSRSRPEGGPRNPRAPARPPAPTPSTGVVAYYFHGDFRCRTCLAIERPGARDDHRRLRGRARVGPADVARAHIEQPGNEHFVEDFKLVTRSLVLVAYRDGAVARWKKPRQGLAAGARRGALLAVTCASRPAPSSTRADGVALARRRIGPLAGILTSISPCPLATNNRSRLRTWAAGSAAPGRSCSRELSTTAGRTLAYTALGAAAVWSLMSMVAVSASSRHVPPPAGTAADRLGLLLLGVIKLSLPGGGLSEQLRRRVDRAGVWGAGLLGIVFALAFCPVSAGLFFRRPDTPRRRPRLAAPGARGVRSRHRAAGRGLRGAARRRVSWLGSALDKVQTLERWARPLTALVLIGVGVYETLRSTLFLI